MNSDVVGNCFENLSALIAAVCMCVLIHVMVQVEGLNGHKLLPDETLNIDE